MPTDIILQTTAAQFPSGYCPRSNQQLANDISAGLIVTLPGEFALFIVSSSEPIVEYRDRTWVKTDATTGLVIGVFTFSSTYGIWAKDHWPKGIPPDGLLMMFKGTLTALETFDGGEPGTISSSTGPFWVRDTEFDDRIPLGVGATTVTPNTDRLVFQVTTPAAPNFRSVYFIKPSGRLVDRG